MIEFIKKCFSYLVARKALGITVCAFTALILISIIVLIVKASKNRKANKLAKQQASKQVEETITSEPKAKAPKVKKEKAVEKLSIFAKDIKNGAEFELLGYQLSDSKITGYKVVSERCEIRE